MFNIIGLIITGIVIGLIFTYLRGKILDKVKDTAKEKFNTKKLRAGLFRISDKVAWAKDIAQLFNLRRICIYLFIATIIYGVGVYKGKLGKPVTFDLRGQEATIQLNEHYLHILESGTAQVEDKEGIVLKEIKVKDIPELRKALKPFGFVLEPIFVVGGSLGINGSGFDIGGGISWLKYFKWKIDSFITNQGIYPLGTSYQITNNSGIGIGYGYGYKGDQRIISYYKFKF